MKTLKKILYVCIFLFILFVGCTPEKEGEKPVIETPVLTLSIDNIEVAIGESYALEYSVSDNSEVYISTSNGNQICRIENDNIIGVSEGTSVVTVSLLTDDTIYKDISVIVYKKLDSLNCNGSKNVYIGKTLQLSPVYVAGARIDLVWSSSNNAIATVDANGLVTALSAGTTIITLMDNVSGLSCNKEIIVKEEVNNLQIANEILNWALEELGTEAANAVDLPLQHPTYTDAKITWKSENEVLFQSSDGLLDIVDYDTNVKVTCTVEYKNEIVTETIDFTVLSYPLYEMAKKFTSQFKSNSIFNSMALTTSYTNYGGTTITWRSGTPTIFGNDGKFTQPYDDTNIEITYTIKLTNPDLEKTFTCEVVATGMNATQKAEVVSTWLYDNVGDDQTIDQNTILPTVLEDFGCTIEWFDQNGSDLDLSLLVGNPILGDGGVYVVAKMTFDGKSSRTTLYFKTLSSEYSDTWELIKLFTDTIASTKLTTYKYTLVSWQSENLGYIPFTTSSEAEIIVDILPYTYGHNRTGIMKSSTEYIVVHDTGNPAATATGEMHARYLTNLNNAADSTDISWHFTVDENCSYQHLPLDEVAYHAGDGSHVFGDTYFNTTYNADSIGGGNRNGIGIESCINQGSDYTQTMRNLAKLVAELLIQYNLGFDRIKQHNDFSGKNCPQVMRENNRWNEFIYLVKLEYFAKTTLKDVTFEWKSLTTCLSDTGKILTKQTIGTNVNYQVTATYNNESKVYTYSSTLSER